LGHGLIESGTRGILAVLLNQLPKHKNGRKIFGSCEPKTNKKMKKKINIFYDKKAKNIAK